jgi:hypothetical protein
MFRLIVVSLQEIEGLITAVATLLLVVVTGLLAWIAYWQWETLEKTDETNRAVNRAVVSGKAVQISQDMPIYWNFRPIFENTGNTKTESMEVFIDYIFDPAEANDTAPATRRKPLYTPRDPEDVYEEKRQTTPTISRIPLNAKSVTASGSASFTMSHIDDMAKKRADGYVYGFVRYQDVFKGSQEHISKFCFVVQPVKTGDSPTRITSGLCRYWNCVDEKECADHKKKYDAEMAAITQRLGPAPKEPPWEIPVGTMIMR